MAVATLMSALLLSLPAHANQFSFVFVANDGSGYDVNAVMSTADVLDGLGGYDVTSISGAVTGGPLGAQIAALVPNPNQPATTNTSTFSYNNVAFPTGPLFDGDGVLFKDVGGATWNLFSVGPTSYDLAYSAHDDSQYSLFTGTLTSAQVGVVPEPASAGMLLLGLLMFAAMRARRLGRDA